MENRGSNVLAGLPKLFSSTPAVALPPNAVRPNEPPSVSPSTNALHKLGLLVSFVQVDKSQGYDIKVEFTGRWEGKFLKAAVKGIEREYKKIQHNMVRSQVQKKSAELKTKE